MRTVWDIPNNKGREELSFGKHPSQKPLRLLRRMIMTSAQAGQLCVAPFAGTGSECVAAKEMGLHFIGFETDEGYVRIAEKRIEAAGRGAGAHAQLELGVSGDETSIPRSSEIILSPGAFRQAMERRGFGSIAELARAADVSRTKIHEYLRGEPVLASTYLRLCEFLDVSPTSLIAESMVSGE
jgi:transcriptional regulator with XRE-family HTH domain